MPAQPAYEITTATHPYPPPAPARAELLPEQPPPGIQLVTLPNGVRTLAYTDPPSTGPGPATPLPAGQPIPGWAKTTALLAPTTGVGIATAGIGLSYAAPGLIAMSHALMTAVAVIAATTAGAAFLLGTARHRAGSKAATTQITQNITATGMFGRATGTIRHH